MHVVDEEGLNTVLVHWSSLKSRSHGSTEILCQGSAFTRKGTKSHCHALWDHNEAGSCFNVKCQLQVCQYIKWCLSSTSQVFWYRLPRAGHLITPRRSTNITFLPQSSLEHINVSLAPTPRFKHLRSVPLMMVWFSLLLSFSTSEKIKVTHAQNLKGWKKTCDPSETVISLFSSSSASQMSITTW